MFTKVLHGVVTDNREGFPVVAVCVGGETIIYETVDRIAYQWEVMPDGSKHNHVMPPVAPYVHANVDLSYDVIDVNGRLVYSPGRIIDCAAALLMFALEKGYIQMSGQNTDHSAFDIVLDQLLTARDLFADLDAIPSTVPPESDWSNGEVITEEDINGKIPF